MLATVHDGLDSPRPPSSVKCYGQDPSPCYLLDSQERVDLIFRSRPRITEINGLGTPLAVQRHCRMQYRLSYGLKAYRSRGRKCVV